MTPRFFTLPYDPLVLADANCLTSRVTGASEAESPSPIADMTSLDRGLKLLELQAEAAKPEGEPGKPSWVNRRVEQLEFLGTTTVRWRASIDFVVPPGAPEIQLGGRKFWLVPVTTLPKGNLVAFDLRDEQAEAMCLPTLVETSGLMAPAVVWLAGVVLDPKRLPPSLADDLVKIVTANPDEHEREYGPFAAAAASVDVERRLGEIHDLWDQRPEKLRLRPFRKWYEGWRKWRKWARAWARGVDALADARENLDRTRHSLDGVEQCCRCPEKGLDGPNRAQRMVKHEECRRCAAYLLMRDDDFRSQLVEMADSFVMHVAIPSPPGTRRIIKWSSERQISFWSGRDAWRRLGQSLGLQCWLLDVNIGGRGGSHHLEVATPPGADIVQIVAKPAVPQPAEPQATAQPVPQQPELPTVRSRGFSAHVHIRVPAGPESRYRATIFVRTSRQGWLTASWLVAVVIAVVMAFGKAYLSVLFPTSRGAVPEAGTAATLLLALLGVIATWLVRPGEHPLASRLLAVVRILILIDVGAVLIGTGDLVLHRATYPLPEDLWLILAWIAIVVAGVVTLAWRLPMARPRSWE
jgi:hypothetical protein